MTTATMPNIDITPHDWSVVKHILLMYVPYYDVWAFGSRATWTAKAYSDLDLAVITDVRFSLANVAHLQVAFEESDLSIKVDVVDWSATSDAFRKIISKTAVVVHKAQKKGDGVRPSNMMMTDYGAFAADYAVERLASLCVPDGGVQTGPFGSQLHQEDYVVVGTPIITVEHLGNNIINHQDLPRISDKDRDRLSKYHLRAGDIVFSRVGSVDRRALVRGEEDGWLFSGRCLRVRPDNAIISSEYLSYFFGHPAFKEHIRSIAVGATMPSLNTQLLSGIFVPYPKDLKEQRAIAHILGTLDDKIELNRRTNETLEAMARDIFKDWFVNFGPTRAKMEGHEPYLTPDLWALFPERIDDEGKPEGWEEKRVEDILELAYGKALKASERINGNVPVYGSGGITGYHNVALVSGPSIIVGRKGTVGSLFWEDKPFFPIDTVFYVKPEAPLTYCFYLLQSLGLEAMNTDAAVPGLNRNNVYRLKMWTHVEVWQAFDVIVSRLRLAIRANNEESQTLAQTRDLLLPKLLSGEIRVKDAEKLVDGAL